MKFLMHELLLVDHILLFFFFYKGSALVTRQGLCPCNPQGASPLTPITTKPQLRFGSEVYFKTIDILSYGSDETHKTTKDFLISNIFEPRQGFLRR